MSEMLALMEKYKNVTLDFNTYQIKTEKIIQSLLNDKKCLEQAHLTKLSDLENQIENSKERQIYLQEMVDEMRIGYEDREKSNLEEIEAFKLEKTTMENNFILKYNNALNDLKRIICTV